MESNHTACFISVDVETGGPNPASFPLLTIGACLVDAPQRTFYVELQPSPLRAEPEALAISGLSLDVLAERGCSAPKAMLRFESWLREATPPGQTPIFVGYNAPFDWMFVCDYFHRHLGRNPFGHAALDLKSLFVGITGAPWSRSGVAAASEHYGLPNGLTHNALEDAIFQAELFRRMRQELERRMEKVHE